MKFFCQDTDSEYPAEIMFDTLTELVQYVAKKRKLENDRKVSNLQGGIQKEKKGAEILQPIVQGKELEGQSSKSKMKVLTRDEMRKEFGVFLKGNPASVFADIRGIVKEVEREIKEGS